MARRATNVTRPRILELAFTLVCGFSSSHATTTAPSAFADLAAAV